MSKRAILYARVSGDDRQREDRNLLGQLDLCRQYALRQGYQIVEELAEDDRGASGAAFELPQLNRIRELAQVGVFDILVTRELDRLSRSLAKQLFVEEELRRAGVNIEYVLGEYPDTPEGNLMKNIRASVAEYERLKVSERMVRGRDLKVKAGSVLVYGRPPFGYTVVERDKKWSLEINTAEAEIVKLIFQWYTTGDAEEPPMSTYRIHQKLHELGIPSPFDLRPAMPKKKHSAGKWNRGTIHRILDAETYAGTWHWNKHCGPKGSRQRRPEAEWIAVEVPAIISRETWEMACSRRVCNRVASRRNMQNDYLLAKHVVCGNCGARLSARTVRRRDRNAYAYYSCPANDRSRTQYTYICDLPYFRSDQVDEIVWAWLKSLLTDQDALKKGLAALQEEDEASLAPTRARLKVVEGLFDDNTAQLERLLDLYLSGEFPKATLTQRQQKLSRTLDELAQEKAALLAALEQQALTQQQFEDFHVFADQVAAGFARGDEDPAFRRYVIESLEVSVTLAVEDEQKVAHSKCVLGKKVLSIVSPSTRRRRRPCRSRPNPPHPVAAGSR